MRSQLLSKEELCAGHLVAACARRLDKGVWDQFAKSLPASWETEAVEMVAKCEDVTVAAMVVEVTESAVAVTG